MKKETKEHPYKQFRRPSVLLTEEEHKEIAHYCIENGFKISEFLKAAANYCVKNKIFMRQK